MKIIEKFSNIVARLLEHSLLVGFILLIVGTITCVQRQPSKTEKDPPRATTFQIPIEPADDLGHGILYFGNTGIQQRSVEQMSLYLDRHPGLELVFFSIDTTHAGVYAMVRPKIGYAVDGGTP